MELFDPLECFKEILVVWWLTSYEQRCENWCTAVQLFSCTAQKPYKMVIFVRSVLKLRFCWSVLFFPISIHETEPSAIFEVKLTSKSTVFHQKLNFHRSVQDFFSTAKKPYIENCVRNMFFSKVIENEPFHHQINNTHRPTTSKFLNQLW